MDNRTHTNADEEKNKRVKQVTKTLLSPDSFYYDKVVKVGRVNFVTRGWVDGKRVYFLERRVGNTMIESKTFSSLAALKKQVIR